MKKINVIGDIHGRDLWKKIVSDDATNIFLGDYFDSRDKITLDTQLKNFEEIVQYKKEHFANTILLLGNHDFHYLQGVDEFYSGYQSYGKASIGFALEEVIKSRIINITELMQLTDSYSVLFSHAGVSMTWLKNNFPDYESINQIFEDDMINQLFYFQRKKFDFDAVYPFMHKMPDNSGDNKEQSPIWIRPGSLRHDLIPGINMQVVGHTQVKTDIEFIDDGLILADAFHVNKYLQIEYNNEEANFRIKDI